jgi:hypothetical protein
MLLIGAPDHVLKFSSAVGRGENSGPGKDDRGELDTQTRN